MGSSLLQTKAQIKAQLPVYKQISEENFSKAFETSTSQTKQVRKMFGKSFAPLTTSLLNKLKGRTVYAVSGQNWWELATASKGASATKRLQAIHKMRILDPETLTNADKKAFKCDPTNPKKVGKKWINKNGTPWWPVAGLGVKGWRWSIYAEKGRDHYCTGGGCDYIWVFRCD